MKIFIFLFFFRQKRGLAFANPLVVVLTMITVTEKVHPGLPDLPEPT